MSKANEMAIQIVQEYVKELENHPCSIGYWRSSEFAQRSYAKTAAYDILERLKKQCSEPPLIVIEEYRDKMDEYACINPVASIMFSVAHDTAENIIDALVGSCY